MDLENQQMLLRMQKIGVHGRGTLNTAEIIRLEMLEREAVAREALKKSIKERLQSIENNS
nr:hypothetical protein EEL55_20765 [Bacillus thuringiensis]